MGAARLIVRMIGPVVIAGLLLIVLTACTGGDGSIATADPPELDALLASSAQAMGEVESVRFAIEQSGAELYIDEGDFLRFVGATGRYAAPRSSDALVRVEAGSLETEVGAVAIDGQIWISNPVTGAWDEAPADFVFDPTLLFDEEVGWPTLLVSGLDDAELLAPVLDDDGRHHVRATVSAERVSTLTSGLVDDASRIDLWIDGGDLLVEAAEFETGDDESLRKWRLALTDYGTDVEITEPELGPPS